MAAASRISLYCSKSLDQFRLGIGDLLLVRFLHDFRQNDLALQFDQGACQIDKVADVAKVQALSGQVDVFDVLFHHSLPAAFRLRPSFVASHEVEQADRGARDRLAGQYGRPWAEPGVTGKKAGANLTSARDLDQLIERSFADRNGIGVAPRPPRFPAWWENPRGRPAHFPRWSVISVAGRFRRRVKVFSRSGNRPRLGEAPRLPTAVCPGSSRQVANRSPCWIYDPKIMMLRFGILTNPKTLIFSNPFAGPSLMPNPNHRHVLSALRAERTGGACPYLGHARFTWFQHRFARCWRDRESAFVPNDLCCRR